MQRIEFQFHVNFKIIFYIFKKPIIELTKLSIYLIIDLVNLNNLFNTYQLK